ncbi:DNA polymerase III subunit alpha, partial [bacterium]|nr:DNA polymerase III subunit alpha [bacterium]
VEIKPQKAAVTVGQAVSLFEQEVTEPPVVPAYDRKTRIQQELEVFGFLVTQHPLELYQERLLELDLIPSNQMQEYIGKRVQMAGWLITGKVVSTKHKELMEFLTFEDMHGLIETVFFPKVYDKYCFMLNKNRPYILRGVVDEDFGAVTLRVEKLAYL